MQVSSWICMMEKSTWWFSTSICQKIMFDKFLRLIILNSSSRQKSCIGFLYKLHFIAGTGSVPMPRWDREGQRSRNLEWSPYRWHGECFNILNTMVWWIIKQCLLFPTEEPLSDKKPTDLKFTYSKSSIVENTDSTVN